MPTRVLVLSFATLPAIGRHEAGDQPCSSLLAATERLPLFNSCKLIRRADDAASATIPRLSLSNTPRHLIAASGEGLAPKTATRKPHQTAFARGAARQDRLMLQRSYDPASLHE